MKCKHNKNQAKRAEKKNKVYMLLKIIKDI